MTFRICKYIIPIKPMLSIQTIINHSKPVYWLLSIYLHINTMQCKKLHTAASSVFHIPAATCRHQNPDLDNHAATDLWNSTSECSANHPPYLLQSSPFNREMCCITLVADYDKHPMVSNFPLKHRSVTVCAFLNISKLHFSSLSTVLSFTAPLI